MTHCCDALEALSTCSELYIILDYDADLISSFGNSRLFK